MNKSLYEKLLGHKNVTTGGMAALVAENGRLSDERFETLMLMCLIHLRSDRLAGFHVTTFAKMTDVERLESVYYPELERDTVSLDVLLSDD